jgi:hypothetical protein
MTPYTGTSEPTLLKIRTFFEEQLSGEVFQATNVPGLQSQRRLESLADVRAELQLVNEELYRLKPTVYPGGRRIKRTVFRPS